MIKNNEIKKTIALPLSIHEKAGALAKKSGLKQYEFIAAAILLAETDEKFLQEILNTHAKKYLLNGINSELKKELDSLTVDQIHEFINLVKKAKSG